MYLHYWNVSVLLSLDVLTPRSLRFSLSSSSLLSDYTEISHLVRHQTSGSFDIRAIYFYL